VALVSIGNAGCGDGHLAANQTDAGVDAVGQSPDADGPRGGPSSWPLCSITDPQAASFTSLSAGEGGTCGIRSDGTLACWGLLGNAEPALMVGTYRDVHAWRGICGVRESGELVCVDLPFFDPPPAGNFVQVATGVVAACARTADGHATCWGSPQDDHSVPDGYVFESLSGGPLHVCGLEAAQHAAVCWDPRSSADLVVEMGPFTQIDVGRAFACGLRADGSASCWALPAMFEPAPSILNMPPPVGPFRQLSLGDYHACALRPDGQVVCWGDNTWGQGAPPEGIAFAQVSAGSNHTCGVLLDGTVSCWYRGPTCDD
jgi:alpha-tubulin suppressor-like RCC1 family protein